MTTDEAEAFSEWFKSQDGGMRARDVKITGDEQTATVRVQREPGRLVLTISHDDADVLASAGQKAVDALLGLKNGVRE